MCSEGWKGGPRVEGFTEGNKGDIYNTLSNKDKFKKYYVTS